MSYLVVMERAVTDPRTRDKTKTRYICEKVNVYKTYRKEKVKEENWYEIGEEELGDSSKVVVGVKVARKTD